MSASVKALCVDPRRVHEIWPAVEHFIKIAMERGDLGRFDDLERDVLSGDALLWLAYSGQHIEAAAVTQIYLTERSKVCGLRACGGDNYKRWIGLIEPIEQYATEQGCDCVRIMGRKGWSRVLRNYRETKVVLERLL